MSFIHFSKEQLNNLGFSLGKEILLANSSGAYTSTSLVGCNTRKYHGMLVAPQPLIDENKYVLLSNFDESVLIEDKLTKLGTHQYPNTIYPEGYTYYEDFNFDRCPQWHFRINDILLKKEIILVKEEVRLLIRYTVVEAKTPFKLKLDPFLVFRNINTISKSNINVNRKSEKTENGIKLKMYQGFSNLHLQLSKKPEFITAPDWNYNNEYEQERSRGYEFREDLYSPGYFLTKLKKGDQIVFSAGLSEISPRKLKTLFEAQLKKLSPAENFSDCLEKAAEQFIVKNEKGLEIIAGFHWFGSWGRDTFISLPGLTLHTGNFKTCKLVIDTMLKDLKDGLFPNTGQGSHAAYNTADASLWFFWALQKYAIASGTRQKIWNEYGSRMKSILENYRKGTLHNIHVESNGMLFAGEPGVAVTWMDAVVDGKPITPRLGFAVELNALWYNAIRFALETAGLAEDETFISEWDSLPQQIESSFSETFWSEEKGYLADTVNGQTKDWSLRPNQVIAASLPYSVIPDNIKKSLLKVVKVNLLTPRGLRTLAPGDSRYKGVYTGNHRERDLAYHQGTIWPWLLGHFAEAYLTTFGESEIPFIQSIYDGFSTAIFDYGIGTIAEIYDGDAPHKAKGAISQAWSVAELLRIRSMLPNPDKNKLKKTKKTEALQTS